MKQRIIPVITGVLFCVNMYAQTTDTLSEILLDEVVISSNKFAENRKNVAQQIDIITRRNIAGVNTQNTGDLLMSTGNVFVQKSQQGGSSPVLRGFEANRVLLVIDGVRMNNAIYRGGHLQNVITVNQNMLERVEVLYGPASTLYGSDALGGIIHLQTKSPKLAGAEKKIYTTGNAFARYSSANTEKTVYADVSIGGKKLAWLQSYAFSDFGDMKMGDHYSSKYPDFGRRQQYVTSINGIDSVVNNADDRVQKFSGYKQWDIMQKLLYKASEKVTHSLNFQYSNTNDVPRYDRLQDIRNGTLRYAEWFYGPQKRLLGIYETNIKSNGLFNQIRFNINYQNIVESRQTREYRRYDRFDSRVEKLNIWGAVLDARKSIGNNEITIGADAQFNTLKSTASRTNITTGNISKLDSRYPDGDNNMNYAGLFAQHLLKMKEGKLVLNDGIRLQYVHLGSEIKDNSFLNLPFTKIDQNNIAVTGNIGLIYMPDNHLRLAANISSGFRAPNIDDVTKLFESSTSLKRVVIPNDNIKPEYTYNADISISYKSDHINTGITGFYTIFRNAIVLSPTTLNGSDSILYDGVNSAAYSNQNKSKANSFGFSPFITVDFTKSISLSSNITYTYGRYINGKIKIPQDHIPPVFGKTSLTYKTERFNTEFFVMYNGWKKIKDYNPDGEDNQQYATPDGMPGWLTINWRGSYDFTKTISLQAGVENILDKNYRYFASGFSAPGRNIIIALRATF